MTEHDAAHGEHFGQIPQGQLVAQAPEPHEGDDIGRILGPVQQGAGALIELLAARAAAEPAIALGGALRSLRDGLRPAFQAPHLRPPLFERRPYTQPSPRWPGAGGGGPARQPPPPFSGVGGGGPGRDLSFTSRVWGWGGGGGGWRGGRRAQGAGPRAPPRPAPSARGPARAGGGLGGAPPPAPPPGFLAGLAPPPLANEGSVGYR